MPDQQKLSSPLYLIPLHDEELVVLGRITIMWAHVDSQLDMVLERLFPLPHGQLDMLLGEKLVGAKVRLIRDRAKDEAEPLKAILIDMCEAMSAAIGDRNTVTHGRWGWEYKPDETLFYRMAHSRRKNQIFYVTRLADLHEKVCAAAGKVDTVWYHLWAAAPQPPERNRLWLMAPGHPKDLPGLPSREEFVR